MFVMPDRGAVSRSARRGAMNLAGFALAAALAAGVSLAHPGIFHDLERVTAAIEKDPRNAELFVERAYYYRLNQQYPEALADLDRAYSLAPHDTHIAAERGFTLSAMGRDREAEAELTRFIRAGGRNDQILAERAKLRERAGRRTQAVADYKAALELKPDVEVYLACGSLQEAMSDLAGASRTYAAGLEKLGPAVTLRLAAIRVETARRRYDAALALIDDEISRSPVKTEWYLRRGDVLDAAGRPEKAREARKEALAEADRALATNASGIHLYWKARAEAALGDVPAAVRDLELSLSKSPRFLEASDLLARLRTNDNSQRTKP